MLIVIAFILIIGFAGTIGNQYSTLKKMDDMQRSLDDLNQKVRELKTGKGDSIGTD